MGRTTTIYGSLEPVWGTRSREGEVRCGDVFCRKQFLDNRLKDGNQASQRPEHPTAVFVHAECLISFLVAERLSVSWCDQISRHIASRHVACDYPIHFRVSPLFSPSRAHPPMS